MSKVIFKKNLILIFYVRKYKKCQFEFKIIHDMTS